MWASQIQYNTQKYDIQASSTHFISYSCLLQIAKDNLFPAFNTKELVGKPFSFPKNSLVSRYPSLKLPRSPLLPMNHISKVKAFSKAEKECPYVE